MAAERDTVDRLIAAYLAEQHRRNFRRAHLGRHQVGTICPIAALWRGWLHPRVNARTATTIISTKRARALFGERTGKGYQLADRVEVRLVEVAPLAGAMRFEMLSEPKAPARVEALVPQGEGRQQGARSAPRSRAAGSRR